MLKSLLKACLAGLLIAMAGWIYLICQSMGLGDLNKVIGAVMFSIGLVAVIALEANLYTGKVAYIDDKQKLVNGIFILSVNLSVAFLIGLCYKGCVGLNGVFDAKIAKTWYRFFADSIGCGICIYIAVEGYNKTKSFVPVILGVMAFILGGFEHCIADAFYYGAGKLTLRGLGYIGIAVVGNSLGALVARWLQTKVIKK